MSAVVVAELVLGGAAFSAADLADAASRAGAQFFAVTVPNHEAPQAHVDGDRVADLERMASVLRSRGLGVFARIEGTLPIPSLRDALGVAKGTSPATLRDRVLVVVDEERTGKRLRMEAPEFPSAYELRPKGDPVRGLLRFASPMWQRAAADAEDLVVPWGRLDGAKLADRYVPALRRRGARLWICGVDETTRAAAASVPAHGLIVRIRLAVEP
jgi:hypothetical protein